MRARWWLVAVIACAFAASARGEPKPKPVDIKAYRDQLIVLQDATGGTYVMKPVALGGPLFYGTKGGPLYEQDVRGGFRNGDQWSINVLAPHTQSNIASIEHAENGALSLSCGDDSVIGLTQITGDKAKQILAKASFLTTNLVHIPRAFARDDTGVYYYVDRIAKQYGGNGYRLFVGKKGAMKQVPLVDVASDSAGEVYSSKVGDLRVDKIGDQVSTTKGSAVWIRGEKRTELASLPVVDNYAVIYRDLGIYGATGTICDDA
jgi:hypothetical protein